MSAHVDLETLGFFPELDRTLEPGTRFARVTADFGIQFEVMVPDFGTMRALIPGKDRDAAPVVGDWVVVRDPGDPIWIITEVLPRRTALGRQAAGKKTHQQLIGANLDTVFVVTSVNQEFNTRRLERYITAIANGGAEPVILLNKDDVSDEGEAFEKEAAKVGAGAAVVRISALDARATHRALSPWLRTGKTVAFVGSSGVGKSTIINALLGNEVQRTADIREDDDEGRHTTTHRQIFVLPHGGLLLDTPGMREFQLWGEDEDLKDSFADVEAFSHLCRFSDCMHHTEPGCAILAAVKSGEISEERLAGWRKLALELQHHETRVSESAQIEKRQKDRKFGAEVKRAVKHKRDRHS